MKAIPKIYMQILKRLSSVRIAPDQPGPKIPKMTLHKYNSYEEYVRIQSDGNKSKLGLTWAVYDNIRFLSSYLVDKLEEVHFGICHGTRGGKEQQWFADLLDADVIGTEISDTATRFPRTIQWDFHEVQPGWRNKFDFIYSNSFDHSYDPKKCLDAWMSCLRPNGLCIIEHSSLHSPLGATELDPFGVTLEYLPYLILTWSQGRYYACDILDAPKINYELLQHFGASVDFLKFVVLRNSTEAKY